MPLGLGLGFRHISGKYAPVPHILLSEEAVVKDVAEGAVSQVVAKPCTGRQEFLPACPKTRSHKNDAIAAADSVQASFHHKLIDVSAGFLQGTPNQGRRHQGGLLCAQGRVILRNKAHLRLPRKAGQMSKEAAVAYRRAARLSGHHW